MRNENCDPQRTASAPTNPQSVIRNPQSRGLRGRWLAAAGEERLMNFVVELDARGDENALGWSLRFDPAVWRFVAATNGGDARHATLHVNARVNGYVGLALALPSGQTFAAGARQVAVLNFAPAGKLSGQAALVEFGDYPVAREVVDAAARVLPVGYAVSHKRADAPAGREPIKQR
ncbi:MAG: hypothetical protein ACREEM_54015 [Blastocatellia bacterium]